MKALIISDDEVFSHSLEKKSLELGYSTILYKWLLKALDNIEEISPDLIIINGVDYPRHWKTLVQFVHCKIIKKDVKIFLFVSDNFSQEEEKKADFLGVSGIFKSFDNKTLLDFEQKLKSQNCTKANAFDSKVETRIVSKDTKKSLLKRIQELNSESL